jgi:Flp pilus assembly protein TadD
MFKAVIASALLTATSLVALAQRQPSVSNQAEVRGQVTFSDGRPAMMGLQVRVDQRGGGSIGEAQTDRQGKFEFMGLAPDIYVVTVRAPGYLTESQEVDVMSVTMGYLTFSLKPDPKAQGPGAPGGSVSALDAAAPEEARKNLQAGRELLEKGQDLDKSVDYFRKAVAAYPQYSQAYMLMGIAYSSQSKWPEAEQALQKSVELNKANAPALVALGAAQNEQKNYAAAEKTLNQAVALAPESADVHFELGRTYWGLQRWPDADQHVAKANALRPNNSGQHILMGNILLRERNAEGALKEYQEALRLDPKGPFADSARQMISRIQAALASAKK